MNISIPGDLWRKAAVSFGAEQHSMAAKGVLIDTCEKTLGSFDWGLMYWYQSVVLSHGSGYTLSGKYSDEQQHALQKWAILSALSDPNLRASIKVRSDNVELERPQIQKELLQELQVRVPHLRKDAAIDKRLKSLCGTLVLDMTREQNVQMETYCSMFNCMFGWNDAKVPSLSSGDTNDASAVLEYTQPFRRRVAGCVHGRQLAITANGHLAMLPVTAQAGDVLCNLFGCPFPLVLRPQGSHCIVVGEAYIRNFMSWEAIREMDAGKSEQMTFVIY